MDLNANVAPNVHVRTTKDSKYGIGELLNELRGELETVSNKITAVEQGIAPILVREDSTQSEDLEKRDMLLHSESEIGRSLESMVDMVKVLHLRLDNINERVDI